MKSGFLPLTFLFLACLIVRNIYEIRKKAGKIDLNNKLLFAAIFLDMVILWFCWFAMCLLDPFSAAFPPPVRWLGFLLFALGIVLAFGAMAQLRGVENIDHLVTTGLFARLRHPMYTGFMLWIVGWGMFREALWSLLAGMAGIASIIYWRWLEDKELTARYGESYRTYRLKTWF